MQIITYSDLHLEFGSRFQPPHPAHADLMVLAGDIITFKDYTPLARFLEHWDKPVLYITGNHEYYTQKPMDNEELRFKRWLAENYPAVTLLQNEGITLDGIHFFGGTMWTDFAGSSSHAMHIARMQINDFRLIRTPADTRFDPSYAITLHHQFVGKLIGWFEQDMPGPRIVISHHAPVINPHTRHIHSPLMPAFNSLDMQAIIEKYQPYLWIYGHTHECDDHRIGKTRIISNQRGYPTHFDGAECKGFDIAGILITL